MVTTYPPRLTLPYRVATAWLEERTLAGELVEPIQRLTIECETLDAAAQASAARVARRVDTSAFEADEGPLIVRGSGLDPTMEHVLPGGRIVFPQDLIARQVGRMPELKQPVEDPSALLAAYEHWMGRYLELSFAVLTEWILRWSRSEPADGETIWWSLPLRFQVDEDVRMVMVDGRTEPMLFHRAVGARQLLEGTQAAVGQEDWDAACQIVGPFKVAEGLSPEQLVQVYARRAERLSDLAFARSWARQRAKDGFDVEMRRWASERGTERLRMGLSDGYRMVSVYLDERLADEAPGFYAHLPKREDPHTWQPRTGPSEEALRLRRAVQERLQRHTPPGMPTPRAEIGWMKTAPLSMCDREHCFLEDEWGNVTDELREWPFEVIGVRGWLDRYTLIAGVYTDHSDRPPPYLLLRYILRPEQYGVAGIATPPAGVSLERVAQRAAMDDDIPF